MVANTLQSKILDLLRAKPNQKADEIAQALGINRTEANRQLYGPLKSQVSQDSAYRWSLVAQPTQTARTSQNTDGQFASTDLARLCRYYLACLGYSDTGISTFLTSKYGDPDYLEVNFIPRSSDAIAETGAAKKLLGRKRTERGSYGLYFGFPIHIAHLKSRRSDWEGFMVEPIFLFPIEQEAGSGRLKIDLDFPIINQKPFQAFTSVERDMLMSELVQLEQELGLNSEGRQAEIDEIAMRLQSIRPEWPWREQIDASDLESDRAPISQLNEPGIYNRAVILMAEKSPFTQGLEKELRDLACVSEENYASTALGRWIRGINDPIDAESTSPPLIEVLPMNSEQRQAVASALTRPMTIITGPPGTGKSQVVTNLLINAAWSGKRILFASKNNKAVDVVETRVNALGSRPILLRVGGQAIQVRLAEFVLSLLSSTTTKAEHDDFSDAKDRHERLLSEYTKLSEESQRIVDLRNDLDRKEQLAEDARRTIGEELFSRALDLDFAKIKSATKALTDAVNRADRSQAGMVANVLWPLFRKKRLQELSGVVSAVAPILSEIKVNLRFAEPYGEDLQGIRDMASNASKIVEALEIAAVYRKSLGVLQAARPLEEIAKEEAKVLDQIARNSGAMWKLWLRLQPSMMSAPERQKLGKYTSLLRMVIEAGEDGQLTKQAYAQYQSMLRDISRLLPCWAVTSLSAKGRIPFEPGHFDLVVFDEASQCDIASAIPLLYRAKAVAIIGDPKQLSHISGMRKGQDQALLDRFGLMEDFPDWAYSYQSLFGLGLAQASGDDIVNLVDHHRSHADVINFSNSEFYEGRLRVATKYDNLRSPNRKEPGIRWVDTKGQVSRPGAGGAVNAAEARAVAATLRDLTLGKKYQGSIGVVTPFRAQANAIVEAINREPELAAELIKREFLADTVHKFQGDERDVMVFSPVVSSEFPVGALGFLRSNGNLFNVAITRARAQLIVVGDISACAACDVKYLAHFAAYVTGLEDQASNVVTEKFREIGPTYPKVSKPELVSDWERTFYVAAYKAGFRLIPQYPIEKYIVDFLMIDGDRKLAIEIDGERYHRNWTGELCRRDQIRNQRLFELGYDVIRFWVYEVRDDLSGCLKRLAAWRSSGASAN